MDLRATTALAFGLVVLSACAGPPQVSRSGAADAEVSSRPIQPGKGLRYPARMLNLGTEGAADVSCNVSVEGTTSDCQVISIVGSTSFADAAVEYVRAARYRPAMKDGVPVATQHSWTIKFRLAPSVSPEADAFAARSPDWSHCLGVIRGQTGVDVVESCSRVLAAPETPKAVLLAAYQMRGRSYVAAHRDDLAIADFSRAIELGDLSTDIVRVRGDAYLESRDFARAAADFEFLLKISLNDPLAFRKHAEASVGRGDFATATRDLTAALALRPDDPSLYIERASANLAAGSQDMALTDLDKALTLNQLDVPALVARCALYRKMNKPAAAAADCAAAESLDPKHRVVGAWPA